MRRWLTVLVGLTLAGRALGATPADDVVAAMVACGRLTDDAARLACFDQTLERLADRAALPPLDAVVERLGASPAPSTSPASPTPRPSTDAGRWLVIADQDRMSRRPIVTAMLAADTDSVTDAMAADLVIQCDGGVLHAYFSWGQRLEAPVEVTPLIGQRETAPRRWPLSDDGEATFVGGDVWSFIEELLPLERLVLRVDAADRRAATAVFNLRGLRQIVPDLLDGCPRE